MFGRKKTIDDMANDFTPEFPFSRRKKSAAGKFARNTGLALLVAGGFFLGKEHKQVENAYHKISDVIVETIADEFKNNSHDGKQTTSSLTENVPVTVRHILQMPKYSDVKYIIYSDKHSNNTEFYEISQNPENKTLREIYSCRHTDGRGGAGPKQSQKDGRTPEGIFPVKYVLTNTGGEARQRCGPAIIGLETRFNGMAICGSYDTAKQNAIAYGKDASFSCVIVPNDAITTLAGYVAKYQKNTIVVIEDSRRPVG